MQNRSILSFVIELSSYNEMVWYNCNVFLFGHLLATDKIHRANIYNTMVLGKVVIYGSPILKVKLFSTLKKDPYAKFVTSKI